MSLVAGLLIRTGTITPRTDGTRDPYNQPVKASGTPIPTPFYLEQLRGSEITAARTTEQSTHLLVLPATAVITGVDLFTDDEGNTYDVDGPPAPVHDPFGATDVVDHIEVALKAVGT